MEEFIGKNVKVVVVLSKCSLPMGGFEGAVPDILTGVVKNIKDNFVYLTNEEKKSKVFGKSETLSYTRAININYISTIEEIVE